MSNGNGNGNGNGDEHQGPIPDGDHDDDNGQDDGGDNGGGNGPMSMFGEITETLESVSELLRQIRNNTAGGPSGMSPEMQQLTRATESNTRYTAEAARVFLASVFGVQLPPVPPLPPLPDPDPDPGPDPE